MPAERALYRAVLRLCREAEQQPSHFALLLGRPPRWYNSDLGKIVRAPLGRRSPFVDDVVRELSGGCTEFSQAVGGRPAARAIRRHHELVNCMGLDYEAEATEICSRLQAAHHVACEIQEISKTVPPRRTPAIEPVPLQLIEASKGKATGFGDVLISHTISCIAQPIFDRSVILIDDVDESAGGVRGLVLNAPGGTTLRQLLLRWPNAEDHSWVESLGPLLDLEVRGGGPVIGSSLRDSVTWLHSHGDEVPGARQVAPSLWSGGDIQRLGARVAAITAEAKDAASRIVPSVWPVVGFAGWAIQQLANEVERGVWIRGRASNDAFGRVCLAAESNAAWRAAMRGVGMSQLADFPRSGAVDTHLMKLLERHHERLASEEAAPAEMHRSAEKSGSTPSSTSEAGRRQFRGRSAVRRKGR